MSSYAFRCLPLFTQVQPQWEEVVQEQRGGNRISPYKGRALFQSNLEMQVAETGGVGSPFRSF